MRLAVVSRAPLFGQPEEPERFRRGRYGSPREVAAAVTQWTTFASQARVKRRAYTIAQHNPVLKYSGAKQS